MNLPTPTQGLLQRRFGGPKIRIQEQGDCWATAVCAFANLPASARNELHRRIVLSDLALKRHGVDPISEPNWWQVTERFLAQRRLPYLTMVLPEEVRRGFVYIASGKSPRGDYDHSILAWGNDKLFWDPHSAQVGVAKITEWITWWSPESAE